MQKIAVLPEHLKNKIAAGEVVERPASVVKELIENSIDSGCTDIAVDVERGGQRLIRVADNGSGMEREDALLALKRHATSKLRSEADLFEIRTMGFRGEALPSIASVSRLSMRTAPAGSKVGVSIEAVGGDINDIRDAPSVGTTVEVRDLFFNTPARKKFLKRESTELGQIIDITTRLALSHPRIGFSLRADGEEAMALPRASGLKERLSQVYGEEFLEGLAEAVKEEGGLRMHAFFSKPGNWRNTRSHQFVFLNGRPIREPFAAHAVEGAYEGNFSDRPGDRHPVFFLFLDADPRRVDFNVHPAKREVRFEDKDAVYRLITKAVREAVREFATRGVNPAKETVLTTYAVEASQARPVEPAVFEAQPLAYRAEPSYIYLGEAFVAFSDGGGITLLDHHAAHERVLYEKFLKGVELRSTRLLFPRQVKLSAREYRAVIGQTEMLCDFGMEVEDFGADTVIVRALPEAMLDADLRGLLSDVAGQIMEGRGPGQSIREAVATRMACHGSIRGSRVLGREGLAALLEDLEKTDSPGQCPHGRPTRVHYSLDELKKLFGRK